MKNSIRKTLELNSSSLVVVSLPLAPWSNVLFTLILSNLTIKEPNHFIILTAHQKGNHPCLTWTQVLVGKGKQNKI